MVKYNLNVSYENENRIVTVNHSTKLGKFVEKCLEIYDLSIENISGIYYYFVDANVYIGDCKENNLDRSFFQFFEEYGDDINNFTIDEEINHIRQYSDVNKFRNDYSNFKSIPNNFGFSTYNYRPNFNITNNYYSGNSTQRSYVRRPVQRHIDITESDNDEISRPLNPPNNNTQSNINQPPQSSQNIGNTRQRAYLYNFDIPLGTTSNYFSNYAELMNSLTSLVDRSVEDTNVLTRDEINNLRSGTYDSLRDHILIDCTQCHITLEDFTANTQVRVLPCKHAFKENAIDQWLLNNSNKCPVCRVVVSEGVRRSRDLTNLFGAFAR